MTGIITESRLLSGVCISIFPSKPKDEEAELRVVTEGKKTGVVIEILPPLPSTASAIISFSPKKTIPSPRVKLILPPFPEPVERAEIVEFSENNNSASILILPPF